MKIKYAIAAALLLSISAFAQKDELKAIKKLDGKEKLSKEEEAEYKRLLTEVEPKIGAATDEQKAEFYYYKGSFAAVEMMENPALAATNFPVAVENLNKVIELEKKGKKKYTEEIQSQHFPMMKSGAISVAGALSQQKKFKEAAQYYNAAYMVDPKDASNLYNAAAMATNGQDYDSALKHYLELDRIGFTGEGTAYSAKDKKTGTVETFGDRATRDLMVKQGLYTDPKDQVYPSLKGEIVKNIALLYIQKGETEKAKQAITNARKSNPDDASLIIAEADLYLKTKDIATYKRLIQEAVQKNPNNADLFYNLGVVSTETDKAEAVKHYEKALQINPDYVNANINMGVLSLDGEKKIVDEMNSLGTSAKDNKRYDQLKAQRDAMYKKALPYFQKAHSKEPDNQYVISMMANVYQALDMQAEAKAMQAKLKK
jgi:tetratricopeptide (TPR) repeat protein